MSADQSPAPSTSSTTSSASAAPWQPQHHPKKDVKTQAPLSSFLAGIAGGSASTILLYPLDLVKVRLQVDERRPKTQQHAPPAAATRYPTSATSTATNAATHAVKSIHKRTIYSTMRGVIRTEGYAGLYKGLTPAIIGSAASWGGFFILYEEMKQVMLQRKIKFANAALDSSTNIHRTVGRDVSGYDISKDMHVDEEIDINTNDTTNPLPKQQSISPNHNLQTTKQHTVKLGPLDHFAASCLSGACMVALTNPLWLIKTRLQLQNSRLQQQLSQPNGPPLKPPYRGLVHAAFTIVKEEGVLALYKGSVPALMLVSHGGIQFVSYEWLKGHFAAWNSSTDDKGANQWKKNSGRDKGTIGERLRASFGYLVMGATSKFIASTTTYPLQVIKARLQQRSQVVEMSEATGEIIVSKREYSGVIDCVGKIWRNEGVGGFFKGCVTNALRVAPSAAITFVVYESVLDALTD